MFKVKTEEGEYEVKFYHEFFEKPMIYKGCTICKIYKDGRSIKRGVTYCSRSEPNFVKSIGRKIALTRALGVGDNFMIEFDKETRTKFWKEYFKARNGRKD